MDQEKIDLLRSFRSVKCRIKKRSIDEMIGICEGIISDGTIVHDEAKFLLNWIQQAKQNIDDPVVEILTDRLADMLSDGKIDEEEKEELWHILKNFTGYTKAGYKAPTALPLNNPPPKVIHRGKKFAFTGLTAFAPRHECMKIVEDLGGINSKNVTLDTNFLVVGTIASEFWKHSTHGLKIKKAMGYRDQRNLNIAIINEDHWLSFALQPSE